MLRVICVSTSQIKVNRHVIVGTFFTITKFAQAFGIASIVGRLDVDAEKGWALEVNVFRVHPAALHRSNLNHFGRVLE